MTHFALRSSCFLLALAAASAPAQNVPVHQTAGAVHGFLEMRSDDGKLLATGDTTRAVTAGGITARTIFHFLDGSLDDETTVFSQRRVLQLVSDHHLQKGPAFPHPIETTIEARTGTVTVRTWDKDGKDDVKTQHIHLPGNVANGILPVITENMSGKSAAVVVPMLVFAPKPRLVKLTITPTGNRPASVAGTPRETIHYDIKIDLGGVAGVVAPIIGKAPPDLQVWTIGGAASTFERGSEPLYPEGPMVTVAIAACTWPDEPKH